MEKEFTELLYQNQGIVHKICNLYFSNRAEKEDYQQELIIQLWRAYPSFKKESKFSTWMYKVCLNSAIDLLRKERTHPKMIQYENHDFLKITDEKSESSENQDKLYLAITMLSETDKAIITLYLDEFTYREIADIIGLSETNIGVKINRIKSTILKTLTNGNK
jgi:RNA polymerase sigma-70 factor (ECF subfamily)